MPTPTPASAPTPAPPRSRLTPEREAELFVAVLELLVETGYEALTMDAVATRAHTSKATIYRQWQGKQRLVAAAMRNLKPDGEPPDTGSLRGDLVAIARSIGEVASEHGQLMAAVSHAVHGDAELASAMRECMLDPDTEKFGSVFERAIARGEIKRGSRVIPFVRDLLLSSIIARPILEGSAIDGGYLVDLVDTVILPALGLSQPCNSKKTRNARS
jgi:AcrR family transcriptional regulator